MGRTVTIYYAATIVFVLLDAILGVNIRAAFLEPFPLARLLYYIFCYACLGIMLWRPRWSLLVGVIESLVAFVALTMSMALRVMFITDDMIETGSGWVTTEEVMNYVLVATIAYIAYSGGLKSLKS